MKKVYILLLLIAASAVSLAQSHRAWVQRYDRDFMQGGGDSSPLCASDAAGNVYVAGTTTAYGFSPMPAEKNLTIFKYDARGAKQWVTTHRRALDVVSVKVDNGGNVYVLAGKEKALLIKYSSMGNLVWEWAYMGGSKSRACAMDLDDAGNVYITAIRHHAPDSSDVALFKFSSAGVVAWSKVHDIKKDVSAKAFLDVDLHGNVCLAYTHADSGVRQAVLASYKADGNVKWSRTVIHNHLRGLRSDDNGNAYLLGEVLGGACAAQVTKFSNAGDEVWNSCDSGMGYIIGDDAFAVDRSGNVAVAGMNHSDKARVTFFDSTGTGLWTKGITGVSVMLPSAVSFNDQQSLIVAGQAKTANGKENYCAVQYSEAGEQEWDVQYDAPQKLNDKLTAMTLLPGGKVIVTGEAMYSQSKDFVTVCYDKLGAEAWVDAVDGRSLSMERAFIQDIDRFTGDIYLAGQAKGDDFSSDMLTVKYNADGAFQWARYFGGAAGEDDIASDVKTDGHGNVYVAGKTRENIAPRSDGLRLIKYNENGDIAWNVVYRDTGYMTQQPLLALDSEGNALMCAGSADYGMMVLKYSRSGELLWMKEHKVPGYAGLHNTAGIKVDGTGNIYIAASSIPEIGTDIISVLKYSPSGDLLWMKEYIPAGSIWSKADDMAIDNRGNIYVSGHFLADDNIKRFVTVKLDPAGVQEWMTVSEPPQYYYHVFNDIAVDESDGVYIMGRAIAADNSKNAITSTIKLGSAGEELWRQTLGDSETSFFGYALAAGENGRVFITGAGYRDYLDGQWITTAAISPSGELAWIDTLAISRSSQGYAISVHPNGGVYVSGAVGDFHEGLDAGLIRYEDRPADAGNILAGGMYESFMIFPNPAPGSFTLKMVRSEGEVCIEVLDLSGKKVHCVNMGKGERLVPINVPHLEAGSYVVRAVTNDGVFTRQLIVMSE